jgi:hypothetical protein
MKPSQLVTTLRRIASNIERSENPDRSLVARDLKKVVAILLDKFMNKTSILIDSYKQEAIKTKDPVSELKRRILEQVSNGEEILGYDGDPVTLANIDQHFEDIKNAGISLDYAFQNFTIVDIDMEGSEGVGVGFSSADREEMVFPWPTTDPDGFYGNGDPVIYRTVGTSENKIVKGALQ